MRLNRKRRTEERAQEAMVPLLEERLCRAEPLDDYSSGVVQYGIVVPNSLIKTYCTSLDPLYGVPIAGLWALWRITREEAIKAYQNATEEILRPQPDGSLTFLNLREYQIEVLDEEEPKEDWS